MQREYVWFCLWAGAFFIFFFGVGFTIEMKERNARADKLKMICVEKGVGWDTQAQACKEKAP